MPTLATVKAELATATRVYPYTSPRQRSEAMERAEVAVIDMSATYGEDHPDTVAAAEAVWAAGGGR